MKKMQRSWPDKAALVSIHDVMPGTMEKVMKAAGLLERLGVFPAALLVVPGRSWSGRDIKRLKSLEASGYELAGHGWSHRAETSVSGIRRLHSLLISRGEAEHLSLSAESTACRIKSCYNWFEEAGLARPYTYVPPAWAWGKMRKKDLKTLPFRLYETQWGIYDSKTERFRFLPVTGYLADTGFREKALKISNLLNLKLSTAPPRIAVHPPDPDLALSMDLRKHLTLMNRFLSYRQVFSEDRH